LPLKTGMRKRIRSKAGTGFGASQRGHDPQMGMNQVARDRHAPDPVTVSNLQEVMFSRVGQVLKKMLKCRQPIMSWQF